MASSRSPSFGSSAHASAAAGRPGKPRRVLTVERFRSPRVRAKGPKTENARRRSVGHVRWRCSHDARPRRIRQRSEHSRRGRDFRACAVQAPAASIAATDASCRVARPPGARDIERVAAASWITITSGTRDDARGTLLLAARRLAIAAFVDERKDSGAARARGLRKRRAWMESSGDGGGGRLVAVCGRARPGIGARARARQA